MLKLRTKDADFEAQFSSFIKIKREKSEDVSASVAKILEAVRSRGDEALVEFTKSYDDFDINPAKMRIAEDDIDIAMKYWLKLEKSEVFMGKHGWGAFMLTEKWSGIKEDFELTKKKIGHNPVPSVPEKIGIDSRAKNATVRGKTVRSWGGSALYLASLKKDKSGEWRIQGIDFYSGEDHKLIKEIKTPR